VEGLSPEAVAVIDMDGTLLSRPRRPSDNNDSQVTSEALEVRQQIERDLVAKINTTLEPLLGADQFRAGASIDCDLTSGEEQEETYKPDESVMVSSQKTEDMNERTVAGGVPGTASNLPNPPAPVGGRGGNSSHMTENITYQSSRVVKHTRIPQGVVRRMSLSVLVGQPARWQGSGKNRHRVISAPSAETLKTIRELVAGVTGFSESRGDQLIVESLPFESSLSDNSAMESDVAKPDAQPAWLEALDKYRTVLFAAIGGLVLLTVLIAVVLRSLPKRGVKATAEQVSEELEAGRRGVSLPEARSLAAEAKRLEAESHAEIAERVRQLAQSDPELSASVLRMWLHGPKSEVMKA
jgi:flagellar M-ring protein FliF